MKRLNMGKYKTIYEQNMQKHTWTNFEIETFRREGKWQKKERNRQSAGSPIENFSKQRRY